MTKNGRKWDRKREMHQRSPACHWCGIPTKLEAVKARRGCRPSHRCATIDHVYQRGDPRRMAYPHAVVLACWKCNQDRARSLEQACGIEELRRRAGRYPVAVVENIDGAGI